MRAASQQNSMGMESLGTRGAQGLGDSIGGFEGIQGTQQLSTQSQMPSVEQSALAGTERFGGAMEAGAVNQEALRQAGVTGGLSESAVSRMTEGSLGGRAGESMQGMQGIQNIPDIQGLQGMQGIASALTGGTGGGMLSDSGGVSALQGQGMMGASLQGGIQSLMGGGGGLGGLQPTMGGGGDLGQQQMAFKKVSKSEI